MNKTYPNILLIAGTGRNSGKTTLAVKVIKKFAARHDVVAIKISPHFHTGTTLLKPIATSIHFNIYAEQDPASEKDSSKMLRAGAKTAYYMEVMDLRLKDAFESLLTLIPPSSPVVIESPALRKLIVPGLFFIVDHPNSENKKMEVLSWIGKADKFIDTGIDSLETVTNSLFFNEGEWHFRI